jgi:hypothetical protein
MYIVKKTVPLARVSAASFPESSETMKNSDFCIPAVLRSVFEGARHSAGMQ